MTKANLLFGSILLIYTIIDSTANEHQRGRSFALILIGIFGMIMWIYAKNKDIKKARNCKLLYIKHT